MRLGDFFKTAPFARPVNPHPVTFTAIIKSGILPDGESTPHKQVAAKVTGALVFLDADELMQSRLDAKQELRRRFVDRKQMPIPYDDMDLQIEWNYQQLWRMLWEWDEKTKQTGNRLFEDVQSLREMVILREANRILDEYNSYVAKEHPDDKDADEKQGAGVDQATFRGAQGGG